MPPEINAFVQWFAEDADFAHYFLACAIVLMILRGKLRGEIFGFTIGGGANGNNRKSAVVGNSR